MHENLTHEECIKTNIKYKNSIFKTYFTIFPDTVQGGTVSNMGPVSPTFHILIGKTCLAR